MPLGAYPSPSCCGRGSTTTFPFGRNIVFNDPPFLQKEEGRSAVIKGWPGRLCLLVSLAATIGVLGELGKIYIFPTYQAFRMITIGKVLTRLELIPTLNFLTMGFIKVSVALYAVSLGTAQLCKLQTYRPLVFPLGVLMLIAAHQSYPNIGVCLEMIERVQPFYALPFQLLLPLLTLLVRCSGGYRGKKVKHDPFSPARFWLYCRD